jgi:hypothetical protein
MIASKNEDKILYYSKYMVISITIKVNLVAWGFYAITLF